MKLRLKTLNDLKKEFGVANIGSTLKLNGCEETITSGMEKYFDGEELEVTELKEEGEGVFIEFNVDGGYWWINRKWIDRGYRIDYDDIDYLFEKEVGG